MLLVLPRLVLGAELDGGTDAGSRWERPLYAQCPPAPPTVPLDGGWRLMPPGRDARLECLMVTADERVLQLEQAPPPLGSVSLIFAGIAFAAGIFFGVSFGWWLSGLLHR